MKKLISLVLALMIIFSASATFSAEDTKAFDGYVYMTVEKLTLGQGFVIEPVKVGYYKEDSLGDITERCLGDKSTFKGDISQYYLEGVVDGGNPQNWSEKDIPSDIYNKLTQSGEEITDRAEENILQSYDFSPYGGWMFTVDNTGTNDGAGNIKLGEDSSTGYCYEDGSVIRLQYSLYGYGEDIGISYGFMPFETTNTFVDRSGLIAYVAEIKDSGEIEKYGKAYTDAISLLGKWDITKEDIEGAVSALDKAGENPSPIDGIYGDINMDGVVDVRDAVVLQKYCVKSEQLSEKQKFFALFDGLKDISIKSVTLIQKYAGEVLKDTSIGTKAVRYYI
ncbi:MAG: hypothetical protein PUE67_06505 [Oscillospiraceae bacterium]|nr:hypothetical protein [Oscillospiraceae bacterium]